MSAFISLVLLKLTFDPYLFPSQVQGSYDSELLQLQESFQSSIVHLLSDAVCQKIAFTVVL